MNTLIRGMSSALAFSVCLGSAQITSAQNDEEPQYGGTITQVHHRTHFTEPNLTGFRPETTHWLEGTWASPFAERLLIGDIEKFGPRGSGEYPFTTIEFVPYKFLSGQLAESWEITSDPLGVEFKIRQGVMWAGNDHIGMESREFTADDAVFHLETYLGTPQADELTFIENVSATDKYTFFVEFNEGNSFWPFFLGYGTRAPHRAPESYAAEGSIDDWRNQVGTGPFVLADYVPQSQFVFERNPNYWDTTTIDGKEYQMPFVDQVVWPMIPDAATQIAALRTGQVDWHTGVQKQFEASLDSTNPDMVKFSYPLANSKFVALKSDGSNEILENRDVRRALAIGTDNEAVIRAVFGSGELNGFPLDSGAAGIWTAIEDMPDSTQALFGYDPDLAKKMLADSGYPDGFELDLNIHTAGDYPDLAAIVAGQWERIGVKANIIGMEGGEANRMRTEHDYSGAYITDTGTSMIPFHLSIGLYGEGRTYNFAEYNNPEFNERHLAMEKEMDINKLTELGRQNFLTLLDDAPYIPFGNPNQVSYTWPWSKNYYGEIETAFVNYTPILSRMWVDQELKADMGY